jgi:hypothetical protein
LSSFNNTRANSAPKKISVFTRYRAMLCT